MKRKFSAILLIGLSVYVFGACTNDDTTTNTSEDASSAQQTTNSNVSTSQKNENWDSIISANGLPDSIPAFQDEGDMEYKQDSGTYKIYIYNSDQAAYQNYLALLDETAGWQLEKVHSSNQSVYSDGDSILLNLGFTYSDYPDGNQDKAIWIEVVTGDEAQYFIDTVYAGEPEGVDSTTSSTALLTEQLPEVNLTEEKYMEEASAVLVQVEKVLDEAEAKVAEATSSATKQQDLLTKIEGYREQLAGHRKAIDEGGYYNSFLDEYYPEDQQYDRFQDNISSHVEGIQQFISSDYNTASNYN